MPKRENNSFLDKHYGKDYLKYPNKEYILCAMVTMKDGQTKKMFPIINYDVPNSKKYESFLLKEEKDIIPNKDYFVISRSYTDPVIQKEKDSITGKMVVRKEEVDGKLKPIFLIANHIAPRPNLYRKRLKTKIEDNVDYIKSLNYFWIRKDSNKNNFLLEKSFLGDWCYRDINYAKCIGKK